MGEKLQESQKTETAGGDGPSTAQESRNDTGAHIGDGKFSARSLRGICIEAGADDAGFVEIGREALAGDRDDILRAYSRTKTIISIVKQINRESVQSASLPVADQEYLKTYDEVATISRGIVKRLKAHGVRGVATPYGFPMDMTRWPGKIWDICHKVAAIEAGLGDMGLHRIVIHPKLGGNILLGSILIDAEMDQYDRPVDSSPCINCGLCAAVCPVGAISKSREFSFMGCVSQNYHEMIGGFQDWIEGIVGARDVGQYRARFRDNETLMKWQSLTLGHSYRCSYCLAVCPAGEETVGAYERDKKGYVETIVKPLKQKKEPVYVIAGTTAEKTAARNPDKEIRYVRNTIRPVSIASFLVGVQLAFNAEAAKGMQLRIHFEFTGKENVSATIGISDGTLSVEEGHVGSADLKVFADSETWVKMLNEEVSLFKALITRKLKLKGNPKRMSEFKSCIA